MHRKRLHVEAFPEPHLIDKVRKRGSAVHRIVIVGGGVAGLRAAERLQERRFEGTVTVIGAERHGPYNRTPLSKQLITGSWANKDLGFTKFGDMNVV